MKYNINNISGEVVKDNDTYLLKDNLALNNLVLSSTTLHPKKETNGHSHEGKEEIYYFIKGRGAMVLRYDIFEVEAGDVVMIPDGAFHQVQNPTDEDLYFVCVFEGSRDH
jgi:mannose-6-phosphate isomerase-like protein (cupin superfamily)